MNRLIGITVFLLSCAPAFAMPQFLQMYRSDPFRNPAVDGCITCHMSPEGGDARNPFGQAFERGGETITPMLRAQFPDRFVYPTSKVSDTVTIHFSDPNNEQMVMETGGMKNLVDITRRTVDGMPAATPGAPAAAAELATPAPSAAKEVPVDSFAREGAFFGSNVVNLPDGKPQRKGGVDFWVGHRFTTDIQAAGVSGLFGFDYPAVVAFGARIGITDHISVTVLRSAFAKTISLSSAFQLTRQNAEMPVTLQVRGGVDGQHNFGLYDADATPTTPPRQYSPFLQLVGTRTFKDRVSVTASPMFSFNTRNDFAGDNLPGLGFGAKHKNTISLGLGAGVRVLPTVSVVGEYIPRLWGFRGEDRDRPGVSTDRSGVSFGLQKSTFRHTFELVVSRQQQMTPVQVALQGGPRFMLGFNIYRKIK
jgi:hypothetical protein